MLKLVRPVIALVFTVEKLPLVALTVPACNVFVTLRLVNPVRFVIVALVIRAVVAVIVLMFAKFVIVFCVPAFKVALIVPPTILPVTVILLKVPLVLFTEVALNVPT